MGREVQYRKQAEVEHIPRSREEGVGMLELIPVDTRSYSAKKAPQLQEEAGDGYSSFSKRSRMMRRMEESSKPRRM